MVDELTRRIEALEQLLAHALLLLETEPRFTAARMDAWLETVEQAQRASKADTRRTVAALELWQRIGMSA